MQKPSNFRDPLLPVVLDVSTQDLVGHCLNNRYFFTKALFRQSCVNFHVGIDISKRRQVIISSREVPKQSLPYERYSYKQFRGKLVCQGTMIIRGVQYCVQVVQKNGCLLTQIVAVTSIRSEGWLYLMFSLLMELFVKLHQHSYNLTELTLKSLMVSPADGGVCLHLWNYYNAQTDPVNVPLQKYLVGKDRPSLIGHAMGGNLGTLLEKINGRPTNKRDIRMAFECLFYSDKSREVISGDEHRNRVMNNLMSVAEANKQAQDSAESWLLCASAAAKQANVDIELLKHRMKEQLLELKKRKEDQILTLSAELRSRRSQLANPKQTDLDMSSLCNQMEQTEMEIQSQVTSHILKARQKQTFDPPH